MNLLSGVRAQFEQHRLKPLNDWLIVTFDEKAVHMRAEPPGKAAWSQSLEWEKIVRVCFKAENLLVSDGIYVFTNERPESYLIPIEASGGQELWQEILRRKLFDAEVPNEAARSTKGLYCWPPESFDT